MTLTGRVREKIKEYKKKSNALKKKMKRAAKIGSWFSLSSNLGQPKVW